jgi:hypothetical protein
VLNATGAVIQARRQGGGHPRKSSSSANHAIGNSGKNGNFKENAMGLFWTTQEEKNDENNRAYADGVAWGKEASLPEMVVHHVVDFAVGCISTNRGIELQEIFNKGASHGYSHKD